MRDKRSDRFIVLPFNVSCVSQASVSVSESKPKKQSLPKCREDTGKAPFQKKPNISKLIKSFKSSLSHFLENLYKEDQHEEEEEEREMVIGFPTDVKHVTHVGLEGLNNTKQNELPDFLSLKCVSSLSLGQFEKAMGAQAEAVQV
ncbi:hypothetical protein LUZ60_013745 [Juncus effusus]|nr:hypothetical protein LUZ60_013745 [Juncus effusus]